MKGKVCIVTGANAGLGKATAQGVAQLGANVVLVCRDKTRGEAAQAEIIAATGNQSVELLLADLSVQQSVRALAETFKQQHDRLDVLINNAAVYKQQRTLTPDGLEMMFATNHLGPFLLTNLLLDTLKASAPARVITISAPSTTKLHFDDLQGEQHFGALTAFGASKMCNLLFTYELARRLEGTGVTANVIHPGLIKTNLLREGFPLIRWLSHLFATTSEKAAAAPIYYASAAEVESLNGQFFKGRQTINASAYANDAEVQRRLWDVSAQLTGVA